MIVPFGLLVLALSTQVPPPDAAVKVAESLRLEERTILDGESRRLRSLADRLAAEVNKDAEAEVRRHLPPPPDPAGAERFVPLPEIVPARKKGEGLSNVPVGSGRTSAWRTELDAARSETATALFTLANRAAGAVPKYYALAESCLRAVITRQPDHPEARRLLGFVPHEGGWATPFAVEQIRKGMTLHPVYGWVNSTWVPHLEQGELPARTRPDGKETWIPAEKADAQRSDYRTGWAIHTEHFQIRTNVPLSEAISFGRHLEILHELFESRFADVIGENLPLAQRFKDKTLTGEKPVEPHTVSYFAEKSQFVTFLRPNQGPGIELSLGLYLPAKSDRGRRSRGHAYFYRDNDGEIAVTATLYHEVSHQLLFESGIAGPNDYKKNLGNFWVFEGLGTYFETLTIAPDGAVTIGGLVGRRNEEARKTFKRPGRLIPLASFVRMNKDVFNSDRGDVHLNYQEAIALTTFLMDGRGGAYRESFLDYVKDACRGSIHRTGGRSLEDRIGKPYAEIEAEFLAFLKDGGSGN